MKSNTFINQKIDELAEATFLNTERPGWLDEAVKEYKSNREIYKWMRFFMIFIVGLMFLYHVITFFWGDVVLFGIPFTTRLGVIFQAVVFTTVFVNYIMSFKHRRERLKTLLLLYRLKEENFEMIGAQNNSLTEIES
jgi:magnesium-transporting ATPase (P-type)